MCNLYKYIYRGHRGRDRIFGFSLNIFYLLFLRFCLLYFATVLIVWHFIVFSLYLLLSITTHDKMQTNLLQIIL
jgi:hypothetical protein